MTAQDSTTQLISALADSAKATGFTVKTYGQIKHWPLLVMTRCATQEHAETKHIYLSAGIHGDEPAGPRAIYDLFASNALPKQHHYTIFPILNPAGLHLETRENADGIDLNRDYLTPSRSKEIHKHLRWIDTHIEHLDICIHLHEDWESIGFYLYEVNFHHHSSKSEAILQATSRYIPTETATEIDGRIAADGLIRPDRVPEDLAGLPESLYLLQRFNCIGYTLETPSSLPLAKRIAAMKAAVTASF